MKNKYLYICLLAIVAIAPGCRKYLYESPINNSYDEIFWVNEKNANQSVIGAYHLFRSAVKNGNAYFTFADMAADVIDQRNWNYAQLNRYPSNFRFGYAPYLEDQLWDWSKFYDAIAQCNLILEKLPTIPENGWTTPGRRETLMGEAYFLRAYAYFYVLRVWGEPVIRTTPIQESELSNPPNLPRSSDADALKQIQSDVDKAISLLDEIHEEGTVRANKYAAYALKTHVSAWQHDYPAALAAADKVIASGQYSLAQDLEMTEIWSGNTQEPIFEISGRYNEIFDETGDYWFFGSLLRFPLSKENGAFLVSHARLFGGANPYVANSADKYYENKDSLYTGNDYRLQAWYFNEPGKQTILKKYTNLNYRDPKNETGAYIDNNLVMMRLADIMLLKAEALANINRAGEAIDVVNEIRDRAHVSHFNAATDGDLKEFILDERTRELIGEGNCFYDLIRTGFLRTRLPEIYSGERWEQKGYYWPLNLRKLKPTNNKLTQNYYWATH